MKTIFALFIFTCYFTAGVYGQMQFTSPVANSTDQNPERNIVLRPGNRLDLNSINDSRFSITGSLSGNHSFSLKLSRDHKTINLNPYGPFACGETVMVKVKPGIRQDDGKILDASSLSFTIHRKYSAEEELQFSTAMLQIKTDEGLFAHRETATDDHSKTQDFKITTNKTSSLQRIFFSNFSASGDSTQKMWIIKNNGDSVFKRPSFVNGFDWKLNHNGFLTAFNAEGKITDMFDSNYVFVRSFAPVNGYTGDEHEFQIFPDGHYFLVTHDLRVVDMTVYDSSYQSHAIVNGNVIQEFDGDSVLIFEWRTFDHIDIPEALHVNLASGLIDAVHLNSIEEDFDGNIIISCRNLDQAAKIDLATGNFIWRLGGAKNEFSFVNDPQKFNYQHDVRRLPNGNITLFNNNNNGFPPTSSAKEYQLDEVNKKATLVWSYTHPPLKGGLTIHSVAMGSTQRLDNGNTFIAWGWVPANIRYPCITEVDANNNIVWEMYYDTTYYDLIYRAHRYQWSPCARPSSQLLNTTDIQSTSAVVHWNNATGAVKYNVKVRLHGSTVWRNSRVDASVLSYNITRLQPGTTYDWCIQTACNTNGSKRSDLSAIQTFTTAAAKEQNLSLPQQESLLVYPNPSKDYITISWGQKHDVDILIQIVNSNGEIVMERHLNTTEAINGFTFNTQNFPPGIYLIRLNAGNHVIQKKWSRE